MLLAKDEKGRLINALEEEPSPGQVLRCPACSGAVRFKKGRVLRPHFAHVALEDCRFYTENESAEHLGLKAALYGWARQDQSVQVEAFLPELQQIADLLVGQDLALEVQCSPLSLDRLEERSRSYRQQGYQVLWLLGRKLWLGESLSSLQKNFLYFSQNMGFHLWELDEEKQLLRLKYLIHQDLHGRVQYQEKSFPFGQGRLLDIFRQPFCRQPMTSFLAKSDDQICRYVRQQLYYRHPKWMALQAQLYQRGDNLLTKTAQDFYPQIQPVQGPSFCQIDQDLQPYYQQFAAYYARQKDKKRQILYPPVFYARILSDFVIK